MAILGPKIIDLDLGTLILSSEMIFLISRMFMSNLNGLCGFYHDPNVGVNLPWSGYPGLHLNHGENPKILGAASKHYRSM
jgi:hypothetical protein